ncbi:3-hydroxybutyryl-CoA dehydrogenase [Hymenobacter arizonensis]|uniref:3-hydroxybutyryl-CoA dehydrogenase n=1 Tax=Hymenobacter arizonensis TaxID=1227077 RepID=A0A1I5XFS0_HYMAR|nr:3-hydroxybutyryl-CoA dehydrogenase [Hymenobacter arizonensis]
MHILVIDGNHVEAEFRQKFGPTHEYTFFRISEVATYDDFNQQLEACLIACNVVFDLPGLLHLQNRKLPSLLPVFQEMSGAANSSSTLSSSVCFGFCGLPTLLNRALLEVSLYDEADRGKLAETCAALGTDYRVVEDRVGLVTPRVICQIINEACFTLQEGTASMQDIDLGMKLGTNYPHGPFAWANAIGVERVYAVLEALWQDTHDERYKVCPLLKRQALRGQPFAV